MENKTHPSGSELEFLNVAYNRFIDLYKEIHNENFWNRDANYRFSREKEIFLTYIEIIKYEPIKFFLDHAKKSQVGQIHLQHEFFIFLRNIFAHFAFFDTYKDVWISKNMVNWNKEGLSIDKFISSHISNEGIKYRIWDKANKTMTYLTIEFPNKYDSETKIYLNDFSEEKEAIIFSVYCMWRTLSTQIESIEDKKTNNS